MIVLESTAAAPPWKKIPAADMRQIRLFGSRASNRIPFGKSQLVEGYATGADPVADRRGLLVGAVEDADQRRGGRCHMNRSGPQFARLGGQLEQSKR